jgi:hypothetical protein
LDRRRLHVRQRRRVQARLAGIGARGMAFGPEKAAPDKAAPDKAAPDKAALDKAAPEKAAPEKAAPGRALRRGKGSLPAVVAMRSRGLSLVGKGGFGGRGSVG